MYDDTKLIEAFDTWMKSNVDLGYGEEYAGDLLADFENFLRETKMLNASPGRVAFGKQLARIELTKRKRSGLTYWCGLELKNRPNVRPRRYRKTEEKIERRMQRLEKFEEAEEWDDSPEAEAARLAAFRRELKAETRENVEKVGSEKDG